MRRAINLYQSSVGKKVAMALSGIVLFGFTVGHLAGNLKVYQGAEKYNAYAESLREVGKPFFGHGQFIWAFRAILLACLLLHIYSALKLTLQNNSARSQRYKKGNDLAFSYASRTMRWGGVILLAFIIYHLLHLTIGTAHHDFERASPYHNLVSAFQIPLISIAYIVAMLPLGAHIYHGLWSATQTLALRHPKVQQYRRPLTAAIALAIVVGNCSMPIAVLAGIIKLEG